MHSASELSHAARSHEECHGSTQKRGEGADLSLDRHPGGLCVEQELYEIIMSPSAVTLLEVVTVKVPARRMSCRPLSQLVKQLRRFH